MNNILIISGVFVPEPLTSAVMNYDLAVALQGKYSVTVLRPYPTRPIGKDYSSYQEKYPFRCITLPSFTCPESKLIGRFRESISFGKACKEYILAHQKEIDFVYNASWQLFGYKIVAKVCKECNIPYMVPIQDIYPESLLTNKHYPKLVEKIIMACLLPIDRYYQKNAYRVRTISDEMADYLSKTRGVSREKYLVLDNWQNDEDFSYTTPPKGKLVFGYVGSINAHSNTELIIRAFYEADIPNSELRIYGGGNHKDLCVNLVKELKMNNVVFDLVNRNEVPNVQSQANVLVLALPKGNGGLCLPSKVTSYMLSGRPVLASVDLESTTSRYIANANCGKTVEPDDVSALTDGFKYFASLSDEEMVGMGKNSRGFAEMNLSKKANLAKVVDAIDGFFAAKV